MSVLVNSPSYESSENLVSGTGDFSPSRVTRFEPGEAAKEQLILHKLGNNGWGRWQYFRQCFSGGWGEGKQKPLSPRSQDMFFRALELIDFPEGVTPSLFLTDEGFLELAWRDTDGRATQIEFGSKESEIYIESSGEEFTVPNERLAETISRHFAR